MILSSAVVPIITGSIKGNHMTFDKEHAIETYRSLISISVEGLKSIMLLNGGAIVALLAYLGQASSGPRLAARVRCSIACFVIGLIAVSLAFVTSYMTQLTLYNQSINLQNYKGPRHERYLWATVILAILSVISFAFGAFWAVNALSAGAVP